MERYRIVIVGAGVAGVSLAYFLSQLGMNDVVVIESERAASAHSSGRSNSNFIHLFDPAGVARLSVASEEFLYHPLARFSDRPLAVPQGALVVVSKNDIDRHVAEFNNAKNLGINVYEVTNREIQNLVPILKIDNIAAALYYPNSGPIDSSELIALYIKHARSSGVAFHFSRAAVGIDSANGKIRGVRTNAGPISCDVVVNAAGAWAGLVGQLAGGMAIRFLSKRRHLISVKMPLELEREVWPFVRCNSIPMYFKAEKGRIIASPMDEDEIAPQDCPTDDLRVAQIADDLNAHTTLKVRHIERSWAGLRTFTDDGMPVVGFDEQMEGLFWLAGQGGTGIQSSPALGDIAARLLVGQSHVGDTASLSPSRWS